MSLSAAKRQVISVVSCVLPSISTLSIPVQMSAAPRRLIKHCDLCIFYYKVAGSTSQRQFKLRQDESGLSFLHLEFSNKYYWSESDLNSCIDTKYRGNSFRSSAWRKINSIKSASVGVEGQKGQNPSQMGHWGAGWVGKDARYQLECSQQVFLIFLFSFLSFTLFCLLKCGSIRPWIKQQ